jgi:hypothetical protein
MNKRIKEFADQAGLDISREEMQKFAELIMAECISACATDRLGKTVSAEELIKQHFGVEE